MRLFGIALLSLVPLLFFAFQGEEVKKRAALRRELIGLIGHMEFQIRHFSRDQSDLFAKFQGKVLEQSGFLPDLRTACKTEPYLAFLRTLRAHLPSFHFEKESEEILLTLGEHFGLQGKESQLLELERAHGLLTDFAKNEKEALENKVKILRMVGLSACVGIWILMI